MSIYEKKIKNGILDEIELALQNIQTIISFGNNCYNC